MESTLSSDELLTKNMEFSSQPLSETCPVPSTAFAGLDCNPTTSTDSDQSTIPSRRTFASVAQRVIIQERLRKAEEEDDPDEEEGKMLNDALSNDTTKIICFPLSPRFWD